MSNASSNMFRHYCKFVESQSWYSNKNERKKQEQTTWQQILTSDSQQCSIKTYALILNSKMLTNQNVFSLSLFIELLYKCP